MNQDITFCANSDKCKLAKTCKRSKENHAIEINKNWSDYSSWANFHEENKKCEYYYEKNSNKKNR